MSKSASAKNREFRLLASLRSRKAPAVTKYMTAARITDGLAPAIGTNKRMNGIETSVPILRPNNEQNATKKPICRPETATRWLSPATVSYTHLYVTIPTPAVVLRELSQILQKGCNPASENRASFLMGGLISVSYTHLVEFGIG